MKYEMLNYYTVRISQSGMRVLPLLLLALTENLECKRAALKIPNQYNAECYRNWSETMQNVII
jgi:hypothetical protein